MSLRGKLTRRRTVIAIVAALCVLDVTAACGVSPPTVPISSTLNPTAVPSATPTSAPATPSPSPSPSRGPGPVIVLDPGHTPTIHSVDRATGLDVSGYENEPEMRDVFAVALMVRAKLQAAGYRVIMTKATANTRIDQAQRSAIANNAHAALALSIHDQAGPNGGIGFNQGNNTVYYQKVGTYRATSSGKRIYFTNKAVAALSAKYSQVFQHERTLAEAHPVALRGDVGYDLGGRELAPGNIWIVQLLSKVPWVYNEAGGNSAGISGLNATDKRRYADGLAASVEQCVPLS